MSCLLAFAANPVARRAFEIRMSFIAAKVSFYSHRQTLTGRTVLFTRIAHSSRVAWLKGIWIGQQAILFAIFLRFIQLTRFTKGRLKFTNIVFQQTLAQVPLRNPATKSSQIAAPLYWVAVTAAKLKATPRILKCWKNYIENHSQRQRYHRHFADVSATLVTIISAFAIELQWSCCKFLWSVRRKALWKMKNTKNCFGSEWREASHKNQLDTCRWWWRMTSWARHEPWSSVVSYGLASLTQPL